MFVIFDTSRCPFCGNNSSELEEDVFQCRLCDAVFNEFSFSTLMPPKQTSINEWS